jgi:hypothetical protein
VHSREDMLLIILCVILVFALAGGGWAHSQYGYVGWSPAAIIVGILLILWLTGNVRVY